MVEIFVDGVGGVGIGGDDFELCGEGVVCVCGRNVFVYLD